MIDPISKSLEKLVWYFENHEIPYVIVGGAAVIVTGRTRATLDVDIILDHRKVDRQDFIKFLQKNGFDATEADLDGFDLEELCTIFLKDGMFKIDLKGKYTSSDKQAIDMAIDSVYDDLAIKVANPINTILYKLKISTEQNYEDALAVYVRNSDTINIELMKEMAKEQKILNKLEDFLEDLESILEEENLEL